MILLNMISKLASMACKISIERDWIIVIAKNAYVTKKAAMRKSSRENEGETKDLNNNKTAVDVDNDTKFRHELTNINATVRRIDLITNIISPLCAGLIMSFLSFSPVVSGTVVSAVFFALWNLASFVIEFSLLRLLSARLFAYIFI